MIHIIDDVLSKRELRKFQKQIINLNALNKLVPYDQIECIHPILKVASQYFDLTKCRGYEIWQHNRNQGSLPWHHDKDEVLWKLKNMMSHPVCGIGYYLTIDENLKGGQLVFENGSIVFPKHNRLVLFDSKLKHCVEEYTGRRHSVNINPWNEKYQPFL